MGTIYLHRNKTNGKGYVGQTIYPVEQINTRWANGFAYKECGVFHNAIKKYGWDNFEHIILEENVDTEQLSSREQFYIAKYHTYIRDPECSGYNSTPGGEASVNTWTEEEDVWLCENYKVKVQRKNLFAEFNKAFPNNFHTEAAVFARTKTLRLAVKNTWSMEEDQILAQLYDNAPKEQLLAALPGRSMDTIMDRARKRLKLSRKVDCNPDYSKEEDEILYKYYEEYGPTYCANLLPGRSETSVRSHANKKLGLKTPDKFTEEVGFDYASFGEYYKTHSIKDTMQKFNLTRIQVINVAHKFGFKRDKQTIKTGCLFIVRCIELNRLFANTKQAAEFLHKSYKACQQGIWRCTSGKQQLFAGYHWEKIL